MYHTVCKDSPSFEKLSHTVRCCVFVLVVRLELTYPNGHELLKLACIPIPAYEYVVDKGCGAEIVFTKER